MSEFEQETLTKNEKYNTELLESICVQHEIDHLNGLRILDRELKFKPIRSNKVGRNEPCSCGSSKKYKKCCMGKEINE